MNKPRQAACFVRQVGLNKASRPNKLVSRSPTSACDACSSSSGEREGIRGASRQQGGRGRGLGLTSGREPKASDERETRESGTPAVCHSSRAEREAVSPACTRMAPGNQMPESRSSAHVVTIRQAPEGRPKVFLRHAFLRISSQS